MEHTPTPAEPPLAGRAASPAAARLHRAPPLRRRLRGSASGRGPRGPLAAALLVAVGLAVPVAARGQIGVMGGYGRDALGELSAEEFALADQADGFHTGIFLDIGLGRFAARPGIVYRRLQNAAFSGAERIPADLDIVEFPLDLRVSAPLPVVTPYLLGGAVLMFPSSARTTINEALVGRLVRLDIGVGLEWDVGFRLWPEIRYGTALGGLVGSEAEAEAGDGSSLETLMIRIGVSF